MTGRSAVCKEILVPIICYSATIVEFVIMIRRTSTFPLSHSEHINFKPSKPSRVSLVEDDWPLVSYSYAKIICYLFMERLVAIRLVIFE